MESESSMVEAAAPVFAPMPGVSTDSPRIDGKPSHTDLPAWISFLEENGVQADRVASPNLIEQLVQVSQRKVDTIICSVLDTDPSVPFNATVCEAFTGEFAAGINVLGKIVGAGRIWITADPDKPAGWYESVESAVANPGLRLLPLRGDYPQTDPTLMLYTLLQRRLPPGHLPTEKGAMLIDAAAAVAVGRCVLYGISIPITPLAVRDHFQKKTHLLIAPLGITLGEVCDFLAVPHTDSVFRAGDFLRDMWVTPDTKLRTGELVIHLTATQLDANPDPCIHCGWCLEACPTRIHPAALLDAAQHHDRRAGKKFGLDACIECGICSYVCPTRLPLLAAIRGLKKRLTGFCRLRLRETVGTFC